MDFVLQFLWVCTLTLSFQLKYEKSLDIYTVIRSTI